MQGLLHPAPSDRQDQLAEIRCTRARTVKSHAPPEDAQLSMHHAMLQLQSLCVVFINAPLSCWALIWLLPEFLGLIGVHVINSRNCSLTSRHLQSKRDEGSVSCRVGHQLEVSTRACRKTFVEKNEITRGTFSSFRRLTQET